MRIRYLPPQLVWSISIISLVAIAAWLSTPLFGQPPVHYFHSADQLPGTVGQGQLLRGGPRRGYFQPVAIQVPRGARVALAADGQFGPPEPGPVVAGMLIGQVYRFRISNIPQHETRELYPTIEVINRLYPPPGKAARFPIPVQFTQYELELALDGKYVTRVIYLEDPRAALPARQDPREQRYFEAGPGQDPLKVADELGRPMAIMRMGSRVPSQAANGQFLFGMPPLVRYPALLDPKAPVRSAIERHARIPRTYLPQR